MKTKVLSVEKIRKVLAGTGILNLSRAAPRGILACWKRKPDIAYEDLELRSITKNARLICVHDIAESFELVQLTSKSSRTLSRLCSLSSFSLSISLNLYLSPPPSGSLPRLSTYTGYTEYFVDVTYPWVRIEP